MSIATDEARKESHRRCLEGYVAPAQFAFQDGYVAGRTAEVTEAEIEASAHRLYEVTHAPEADPGWHAISKIRRETYREQAAMMLEAARKAVTE